MKRFIFLGLSFVLLAGLAACSKQDMENATAQSVIDAVSAATTSEASVEAAKNENSISELPTSGSNLQSGIYTRTTARTFSPTPVDAEKIQQLVQAAFSAPTGGNQHALEFIVVTDREVMQRIKERHPYATALDTAPLLIVVAANREAAIYQELLEMDSGIAAYAILVQASELGFSSVAMSIAPQAARIQAASDALNLPEFIIPELMLAIGYPDTDTVSSASVTYYDGKQVHYNQYTQ